MTWRRYSIGLLLAFLLTTAIYSEQENHPPSGNPESGRLTAAEVVRNINTGTFTGEPYDFNFKQASFRDVITFLSRVIGVNIVVESGIEGKLTVELGNIPWDQGLAVFLRLNRLEVEAVGDILWIKRQETFAVSQEILLGAGLSLLIAAAIVFIRHRRRGRRFGTRSGKANGPGIDPLLAAGCKEKLDRLAGEEHVYRDEGLTLPRLADRLQIPPYQLSRIFRDLYGKTFSEWLGELRVGEVIRILQAGDGEIRILEAAHRAGFNSKTAFNQAFKRHTGKTPSEFLRQPGN